MNAKIPQWGQILEFLPGCYSRSSLVSDTSDNCHSEGGGLVAVKSEAQVASEVTISLVIKDRVINVR